MTYEHGEDVKSEFVVGYVHLARVKCWSCEGHGKVEGYPCGVCEGAGDFEKGCGGAAEVDTAHVGMGAYCLSEGRFVPGEEVVKVGA